MWGPVHIFVNKTLGEGRPCCDLPSRHLKMIALTHRSFSLFFLFFSFIVLRKGV